MTAPLSPAAVHQRQLGPAFDALPTGLVLVGAPPAAGKTCISLNLAAHYAAHLEEAVLYFSPATPKEVILARLAKNLTPEGDAVDLEIVADLPLTLLDGPEPSGEQMLAAATAYVEQHGQPAIVLVNDLQSLRPSESGLAGLAAAVSIMADLRGIAKVCDAPVVLLSQLTAGKGVAAAVREQADRVAVLACEEESPESRRLTIGYGDPPEPESGRYALTLSRATGVLAVEGAARA